MLLFRSMKARGRRKHQGSKQDRESADADHDQYELKERHDAHHTAYWSDAERALVALVTRSTLSPRPFPRQQQPNFSLGKNVAASRNARRDSRTRPT
jgi:hypothetical protein